MLNEKFEEVNENNSDNRLTRPAFVGVEEAEHAAQAVADDMRHMKQIDVEAVELRNPCSAAHNNKKQQEYI